MTFGPEARFPFPQASIANRVDPATLPVIIGTKYRLTARGVSAMLPA